MAAGQPGGTNEGQGGCGNQHISCEQDDSKQALHLFFQEYCRQHADELANACVLLICDAISDSTLVLDPGTGAMQAQQTFHGAQEAAILNLRCKFLTGLIQQSELPIQAIYEAVCANNSANIMDPKAVKQWLQ